MILSVSFEKTTYNVPPFKFEAGTPNIAGAIGLGRAIEFVRGLGWAWIQSHDIGTILDSPSASSARCSRGMPSNPRWTAEPATLEEWNKGILEWLVLRPERLNDFAEDGRVK